MLIWERVGEEAGDNSSEHLVVQRRRIKNLQRVGSGNGVVGVQRGQKSLPCTAISKQHQSHGRREQQPGPKHEHQRRPQSACQPQPTSTRWTTLTLNSRAEIDVGMRDSTTQRGRRVLVYLQAEVRGGRLAHGGLCRLCADTKGSDTRIPNPCHSPTPQLHGLMWL